MKKDVEEMVAGCDVYKEHKYMVMASIGLLQQLTLLNKVWENVTMDFIEGFLNRMGSLRLGLPLIDSVSMLTLFPYDIHIPW